MSKKATATPELTQERLREMLHYDPETGTFTWLVSRGKARAGRSAGSISAQGYVLIGIAGELHRAHRLAFLYMLGSFPGKDVDHANRNRADNRWNNIREANRVQNCRNCSMRADNKSGVKGVNWEKRRRKWQAYINVNGQRKHLGYFVDIKDAAAAYASAARGYFGEFANPAAIT